MGLIAIGDIHGCHTALESLLDELSPHPSDQLVFVGDYIDRGPASKEVIDRLLELRERYDCIFLRGNHEAMMLDYLNGQNFSLWQMNGGVETLESYAADGSTNIPEEHREFLADTRIYHETEEFFFVHGGLKPNISIAENKDRHGEDVFLWERGHLEARMLAWEKTVVCGHTPQPQPIDRPKLICIDTGCVFAPRFGQGSLTAVRLPERKWISVNCL
jgi:serine/threonine protein phosphatase 1